MGEQGGANLTIIANRRREIAVEVCYRCLYMRSGSHSAKPAAADGIVHPASATFAGPRIQVKIKPPDQLPLRVRYVEKFRVRMPELNIRSLHRGENDPI